MSSEGSNGIPSGLGRIIRDETGQVVAVETGDDMDSPLPTRERDLVEEAAAAAVLSLECQSWVSLGHMPSTEDAKIDIIRGECGTPGASGDNRFDLDLLRNHHCRRSQSRSKLFLEALPDVHSLPVVSRFSSKGEVSFLQKLISRHGSDVEAMARDRKLNPDQRTEGQLRRAIRRAAGGE
jgi:nucleolar protein 16